MILTSDNYERDEKIQVERLKLSKLRIKLELKHLSKKKKN